MKTSNLLKEILDELNFRKAINPIVIEIAEISSITDYMVIASMDSDRGVKALADYVNEKLKKDFKIKTLIDGVNTSGWIIIDTGQIMIHLFHIDMREYYDLESLWNEGNTI